MPSLKEILAMKNMAGNSTEKKAPEVEPVVEGDAVDVEPCLDLNSLSRKDKRKLGEILEEDFGRMMVAVGLDGSKASEYLPEELKPAEKGKKGKKGKKEVPFSDWREAKKKEDLLSLKRTELVEICKKAGIPTSLVNKGVLADRVWGIEHPDEAPVIKKGKRGRPSKKVVEEGSGGESSGSSSDEEEDINAKQEEEQKPVPVSNQVSSEEGDKVEEVRFSGDKLDANGTDVYARYNGTDFIVTSGDDVE